MTSDFSILECILEDGTSIHLKVKEQAVFGVQTSGTFYLGADLLGGRWIFSLWALPTGILDSDSPIEHEHGCELPFSYVSTLPG